MTLATLTFAFRGHDEHAHDDICEGGNFLGMVCMMAQYDEILATVISLPARATKYLSPKIQNELIELLARTVTVSLVHKINASPFWALILDSTSDITRIDQLSVIIRRVQIDGDKCSIEENFLGFVKLVDATATGIVSTTKAFLHSLGINFSKIRGQGYDGASVMSGIHAGVQTLIKSMVTAPVPFVHCGSHNLNLVINDAVNSVVENENFFGLLRELFTFFASSLNRCRDLGFEAEKRSLTLKKLCTTRWSSRIDAVRAVRDSYPHIMRELTRLSLTSTNKAERDDAKTLKNKIDKLEFVIFIVMWERVLRAINNASRELQSQKIDLSAASRLLNCALSELVILRSSWNSVLLTATALAQSWSSSVTFENKRNRKTKRFFNELSTDRRLTDPEEAFKVNVFYQTVDNAIMQLKQRFEGQKMVTSLFSCLHPYNMSQLKSPQLETAAEAIVEEYPTDFTEELVSEFRSFVNEFRKEIAERQSVTDVIRLMLESRVSSSFSQVYKLLILFATIPVTVATAERSFSKLKLIKTYLRFQMSQERLAGLALLSIENKEAKAVDKKELIHRFANASARRKEQIGV